MISAENRRRVGNSGLAVKPGMSSGVHKFYNADFAVFLSP